MGENTLSEYQIAIIRSLWELAQGRIDALYSPEVAEQEKQAIEDWITSKFPNDYMEIVRSESQKRRG
jgi:hypothetical protein